jgi:hypothetical protein
VLGSLSTIENAYDGVSVACEDLMHRVLDQRDARAIEILDQMLSETPEFADKPLHDIIAFLRSISAVDAATASPD